MWTDAAIENSEADGARRKKREQHCLALGAPSRNAVIGKANRIGVKLTGHIHCLSPRASRPSTERPRRPAIARTDAPYGSESPFPLSRASESRHGPSPRPRSGRC